MVIHSVYVIHCLGELGLLSLLFLMHSRISAMEVGFAELFKEHFDEIQSRATFGIYGKLHELNDEICPAVMSAELSKEIASYQNAVQTIVDATVKGPFKGRTFAELQNFTQEVGARPSGSVPLENAIKYIGKKFQELGYTNILHQPVKIPFWHRGHCEAMLLTPNERRFEVKSYGLSVNTPESGISGKIMLIYSLAEIDELEDIEGKIIVFASTGSDDNRLSLFGVEKVAKQGAIGVLARTPSWSVYTVGVYYGHDPNATVKIPAAYISREDVDYIIAMNDIGLEMEAFMKIIDNTVGDITQVSENVVGDFLGTSKPHEFVLCAAHSDSWDTGQGIQDDGFGIFMSMMVPVLIDSVGLRPARTLRTGIFTGEETGLYGSLEYIAAYKEEISNFSAVIEPDWGITKATGLLVSGSKRDACIIRNIIVLVEKAYKKYNNNTRFLVTKLFGTPTNAAAFTAMERVPSIVLNGDGGKPSFMELHHTDDDNMEFLNSVELDKGLALLASTAYVLADMKELLPKLGKNY